MTNHTNDENKQTPIQHADKTQETCKWFIIADKEWVQREILFFGDVASQTAKSWNHDVILMCTKQVLYGISSIMI